MSFSRYPNYKDSGVRWLGHVPAHWQVAPVSSRYHVQLGKMLDSNKITGDHLRPYLRVADVQWGRINTVDLPLMDFDESARAKFSLSVGDLLVNEGGSPGRSAIWDGSIAECYCQKALHRLRPYRQEEDTTSFFYYVMVWATTQGVFVAGGNETTIEHVPAEKLRRYRFAFPPFAEQLAIANSLDRETAKIDTVVTEYERLIQLLREKRQAVVSHAVTKGLNPGVSMRDSGIDWVGDIPAHWEAVRNKAVFREVDERAESDSGELLTVSHLTGVTKRSEKDVNMFLAETLEGYKMCARNDLVINTMWAWMGALGCSPHEGLVSPSYNVYRPRRPDCLLPSYYDYLCRLPTHAIAMKARSTGVWESRLRLYPGAFLDMRMPLPPREEQQEIVAHLREQLQKWDALVDEAQRAVDLLRERRTALISAAVTGQIDVRAAAARTAA